MARFIVQDVGQRDLYSVEIRNNVLRVDTGQLTKRSVFTPDQVTYPKKS